MIQSSLETYAAGFLLAKPVATELNTYSWRKENPRQACAISSSAYVSIMTSKSLFISPKVNFEFAESIDTVNSVDGMD